MNCHAVGVVPFDVVCEGDGFGRTCPQWRVRVVGQGHAVAVEMGNNIVTVTDTSEWQALINPIYDTWTADMASKGLDGQALIDQAKSLMGGECKGVMADM